MKCHEVRELLIHYSNGEIGRSERELLQAHLAQCESCYQHLQSLNTIEQQVRTGLHEAANAAEPSALAWQKLSHKLAERCNDRAMPNAPLPLVLRLMGGLSAAVAVAVLVVAAIVSPTLGPTHVPPSVTENALPLPADASKTMAENSAPVEVKANSEQDGATSAHSILSAPQRQTQTLLRSEPDSFLPKTQVHYTPDLEFLSQTNCVYCLKMR